jgi:hypothetical protein
VAAAIGAVEKSGEIVTGIVAAAVEAAPAAQAAAIQAAAIVAAPLLATVIQNTVSEVASSTNSGGGGANSPLDPPGGDIALGDGNNGGTLVDAVTPQPPTVSPPTTNTNP